MGGRRRKAYPSKTPRPERRRTDRDGEANGKQLDRDRQPGLLNAEPAGSDQMAEDEWLQAIDEQGDAASKHDGAYLAQGRVHEDWIAQSCGRRLATHVAIQAQDNN